MEKVKNIFKIEFEEDIQICSYWMEFRIIILFILYDFNILFRLIVFNTDIYTLGNNFINSSMYRFIFYIPILYYILPIILIIQFRKQSISFRN